MLELGLRTHRNLSEDNQFMISSHLALTPKRHKSPEVELQSDMYQEKDLRVETEVRAARVAFQLVVQTKEKLEQIRTIM